MNKANTSGNSLDLLKVKQNLVMELAKFSKSKNGKGPESTTVEIYSDVVLCTFEGFLTKAEEIVVESGNAETIFMNRVIYVNKCRDEVEEIIYKNLQRKIKYLFPSYIPQKQIACWTIFLD